MQFHASVDATGALESGASDALVPWWSFSKTLIAALALCLAEQGRLDLDAVMAGKPYTARQLLQNRSGVPDYGGMAEYHQAVDRDAAPWADAELLSRVRADALLFTPDTGWEYSNVGYLILRRHLEAVTGKGLADLLHEIVLAPLGLSARLARTRADMAATVFGRGRSYHPGWVYHGCVVGPVCEAARALHAIMTGAVLTPAARAALVDACALTVDTSGRPWRAPGYGLGVMVDRKLGVIGHSAGGPGSVGAVYHALATGRTAAVFSDETREGACETRALDMLGLEGQVY